MDGMDPLNVFPEELWKLLFDYFYPDQPFDLLNISRSCGLFHRLLEPTECEWLFQLVLPHLFPYLGGGDLLKCRAVCKTWRRNVDNFLENFETRHPFDESTSDVSRTNGYNPLSTKKIGWVKFEKTRQLRKFIEEMEDVKENPIVGRAVWFDYLPDVGTFDDEELDRRLRMEFFNTGLEFLSKFGDHVRHMTLGNNDDSPLKTFYHFFRHSMQFVPKLRSLHIYGSFINAFEEDDDELNRLGPGGCLNDDAIRIWFRQYVELYPPLEIPTLETIEIKYVDELPQALPEKLITTNASHLKRLILDIGIDCMEEIDRPYILLQDNLPNLTELNMTVDSLDQLEHFFRYIDDEAPLGKLTVDINENENRIQYDTLCRIINKFGESLRKLTLICYAPTSYARNGTFATLETLHAPRLRSLELEGLTLRSDLLPNYLSSSLEYLCVKKLYGEQNGDIEMPEMDLYRCIFNDRLHQAEIWNQMQKLKLIKCVYIDKPVQPNLTPSNLTPVCSRELRDFLLSREGVQIETMMIPNFKDYL